MELKANELRLENYLMLGDEVMRVTSIQEDFTIRLKRKNNRSIGCFDINYDLIKPIPLTEDWLIKFGFKKWEAKINMGIVGQPKSGYVKNSFVINYNPNKGYTYDKNLKPNTVYFNHLHQLQNLYFALSQKELTF